MRISISIGVCLERSGAQRGKITSAASVAPLGLLCYVCEGVVIVPDINQYKFPLFAASSGLLAAKEGRQKLTTRQRAADCISLF